MCLCRGRDGCCVFFLNCEAWSYRCLCMGSMTVSSCRCCMSVSCVQPVAVLNAAFCMTFSLLMLVEEERTDHMEEAYSRAGLMTAFYWSPSIWSPLSSSTNNNKLQVIENAALRTATGCKHTKHLHDETLTFPIHEYLQLHASQYRYIPYHTEEAYSRAGLITDLY